MSAEFAIVADHANQALRVTMSGFFLQPDVDSFLREVHIKLDQLRCRPNEHLMLCDARGMKIQAKEIVQSFSAIVGHPRLRSKKLAFVNGTSLSRLQTKRLTDREGVCFFGCMTAAESWLFSDSGQSAAMASSAVSA
jgi:hypothetical protein